MSDRHKRPNLSKSIIYNLILTVSGYIFPILTFPYVTRILGPESYGMANYVLGIVDYAVLLSTLGIGTIGVREIAKCNGDEKKMNTVFSSLLSLHLILALFILFVYLINVFAVGQFRVNYQAYLIGLIKILANVFLIEWLYEGMQDFRYITIRSIVIKLLYVIAVFIFIRSPQDYIVYILLSVLLFLVNAIINWRKSKQLVSFQFSFSGIRQYFGPAFSVGLNSILLSFYGTFIVLYLGLINGNTSVGYYTTATKLYAILLSVLSAFNGGLMPYINSLYGRGDQQAMKEAISKSLNLVLMFSIPVATYGLLMADDIITIIAGPEYSNSIIPFKIIIFNIILVGVSQVTELQVLLTINKTRQILFCTGISVVGSVLIMVLFTPRYAEISAAYAVMIPHVLEAILLYYFAKKGMDFLFPWRSFSLYIVDSFFMILILLIIRNVCDGVIIRVLLSIISFFAYIMVLFIVKEPMAELLKQKAKNFFDI